MAKLLLLPATSPFTGRNGQPHVGTLEFLDPATRVRKAVYTSAALTVELGQPVASDSSGVLPQIWCADPAIYYVVSECDGVVRTYEQVEGGTLVIAPDLEIGTVIEGPVAAASITGISPDLALNLTLPRGSDGDAATISFRPVLTGAPGTNASLTNYGTSAAADIEFTIPRGNPGQVQITGTPASPQFAKWTGANTIGGQTGISNADWNGADLSVDNGGTGRSALTANALLYGAGTSAVALLAIGTNGQVLTVSGGVPVWQNPSATPFTVIQTDAIASPVAQITSPDLTGYNEVTVDFVGVTTATGGSVAIRISNDNVTYSSAAAAAQLVTPTSGGLRGALAFLDIRASVGVAVAGQAGQANETLAIANQTGGQAVKIGWSADGGIKRIRLSDGAGANFNGGSVVWRAR